MGAREPAGEVGDANALDPEQLGFMCGLEIHQQLATGKLHSRQPGVLYDHTIDTIPADWKRVSRRLRAAEGEAGEVDVAARFEARRNRSFVYVQSPNAGLIELDEAPPLDLDSDAVDISLTVAAMMQMHPVSMMQSMRKTVVDGSNTSGFQRTTLVATGGAVQTEDGPVGITLLCLEEDSARKLDTQPGKHGEQVIYTLDRLGVPLIEIATDPEVQSPEHAKQTAIALGQILRDTRRVKRGLGTIRQDLNVSLGCGDRVEIKGCQDLAWIPRIIRLEMARQLHFYRLANRLRSANKLPGLPTHRDEDDAEIEAAVATAAAKLLPVNLVDVSSAFAACESKMIVEALAGGASVVGVKLSGFAGDLGSSELDSEGAQMPRLGRELASAAKMAGVRGIFHSDELPAYGITEVEVAAVRDALGLGSDGGGSGGSDRDGGNGSDGDDSNGGDGVGDGDAFVLCVALDWQAELALESVVLRARKAFHRILQEVRNVVIKKGSPEDGTTTAMRPLPGGARMYPETDVPVFALSESHWNEIASNPPLTSDQRRAALVQCDLSENQVDALLGREEDDEFLAGVKGNLAASLDPLPDKAWASLLLDRTQEEIAGLSHAPNSSDIPLSLIGFCLEARESGGVTRDGLVPLAARLLTSGDWNTANEIGENGDATNDRADAIRTAIAARAEELGVIPADTGEIEAAVERILDERADFVAERGMAAMGPLMGVVIGELGSGADGKAVSAALKEAIGRRL